MSDITTPLPGSGGGGVAGSSFSDALFNVFNDADQTKRISFSAAEQAPGSESIVHFPSLGAATSLNVVTVEFGATFGVDYAIVIVHDTGQFFIANAVDQTKYLVFDVSGNTTGITQTMKTSASADRTATLPNATTTLAGLAVTQTFTAAQTIAPTTDVKALQLTHPAGSTQPSWEVYDTDLAATVAQMANGGDFYAKSYNISPSGLGFSLNITNKSAIAANRTYNIDNSLSNTDFAMTAGAQTLSSKTITVLKVATTVSGIPMISSSGADPPAANFMGKVARTAQTAAIAAFKITDTCPAGMYEVSYYMETTTANVTDGTLTVQVNYTDRVGATNQITVGTLSLAVLTTGTTALKGTFVLYMASGDITVQTNLTGAQTTSRYSLDARAHFTG